MATLTASQRRRVGLRVAPSTHAAERTLLLAAGLGLAASAAAAGSSATRVVSSLAAAVALASAWWLPASSKRRGWLLLAVGFSATAFGAGIGPAHLSKEGVTTESVAASVAFVAGLALVVSGTRDLTSGRRGAIRILAVAGTTLGLLVALFIVVPGIAATNVPETTHGRTPADLGLGYEDVWFETSDGVRLHGWYVPSRNGAAVVVRHGAGSTAASALDQAAVLAAHGFGVLVTDARGHGRSGGRAMDFGWYGDLDTRAAVDLLAASDGIRPDGIGALGLSMGGEEVLGAAAADRRLQAVVAEGATGRTAADNDWFSDAFGVRGWIQEQIELAQSAFTDALTPASKPTPLADAVADGPPALLIAAGTVEDEVEVATRLAAMRPEGVKAWTVAGASHTDGLDTDPEGWEARVVGFLEDALLGRSTNTETGSP